MAVTAFWYAKAFLALANEEHDILDDSIKVALTTNTYTPNQDTHDYYNDVTNELATANGYTATGQALANDVFTTTLNVATYDADNTVWTSSGAGFTARRAVTYNSTGGGSDATRGLLWWMDFGQDETASGGGTFTLNYNASGIATITATDATGFP